MDSGVLYNYLGIRKVDSLLAENKKWMLESGSILSPKSYISSDEFQITQI
jgi:hypothetical protein